MSENGPDQQPGLPQPSGGAESTNPADPAPTSSPDAPTPAVPASPPPPANTAAAAMAAMEAREAHASVPSVKPVVPQPMSPFVEAEPPPPPGPPPTRFLGPEPAFWSLLIRGALLLLVTLGIYRFWLATDVRRFLWSNTEIAGDGLEYIGTARELLLGFLVAIVLLVPINVLLFFGAFVKGTVAQFSGLIALLVLALGQFAVYRARRYRLTRTVYRGLRLHQTGSAWRYAVCALFWWGMIGLTLGLAYPFAQASLERFKVGHTFYGDLRGRFEGSGFGLFFRGLVMWLLVMVPLLFGLVTALAAIDWSALGEGLKKAGDDPAKWLDDSQIATAAAIAMIGISWSVFVVAALYPWFQAMVLRWWISGVRFGTLTATSRLRTRSVYGVYMRFVGFMFIVGIAFSTVASVLVFGGFGRAAERFFSSTANEVLTVLIPLGTYVIAALAYSTVYQATVKLRLWKLGFDTVELAGIEALDGVKAAGGAGSAVGEGLADALHVGGI